MRRAFVLFSFLALLRATNVSAITYDQHLGCEVVSVFSIAKGVLTAPTYTLLHCPDAVYHRVRSEGTWSPGHR